MGKKERQKIIENAFLKEIDVLVEKCKINHDELINMKFPKNEIILKEGIFEEEEVYIVEDDVYIDGDLDSEWFSAIDTKEKGGIIFKGNLTIKGDLDITDFIKISIEGKLTCFAINLVEGVLDTNDVNCNFVTGDGSDFVEYLDNIPFCINDHSNIYGGIVNINIKDEKIEYKSFSFNIDFLNSWDNDVEEVDVIELRNFIENGKNPFK